MGVLAGIVLVAVPLYLLRRPSPNLSEAVDTPTLTFGRVVHTEADAGTRPLDVVLGPVQRVRCGASANQISNEGSACDALPQLETALSRAISGNVECAPRAGDDGSINYVLEVDFSSRRLNVFAGKSGQWRGSRVKKAVACVQRALPSLGWADVNHRHEYYAIAILATYPAPDTIHRQPTFD